MILVIVHGKDIYGNRDFNHYVENMMQSRNHAKSIAKNNKFKMGRYNYDKLPDIFTWKQDS